MCGIFGYIGYRSDSPSIVLNGLKSLEYRGYDSWGVAVVAKNDGKSEEIKIKKMAGKIGKNNVNDLPKGTLAFGHTRWATHGGITDTNSHPHLDCTGSIALIHNGIFENYEEIKQKLIKSGHKFKSETDTEIIVHLIEELAKKKSFFKAVQTAFMMMKGLNGIIAINKTDRMMIAARNGSPLVIGYGKKENILSSDVASLLPFTNTVYFLEDGEMATIQDNVVNVFNAKSGLKITPKKQKLNWKAQEGHKGKFPYFMLKEIYEQPKVLAEILENSTIQTQKMADLIKKSKGAYLIGCGTASYACIAGTYLFSKIAKRHVNFAVGSEFGYHLDFLNKKSLVIAVSQSGETMGILESVKMAKNKGSKIASLVNVFGSSLYRISDHKMLIGAGPEKGVASTKAFTGMIAHLTLLAYSLNGSVKEGQKVLKLAVTSSKEILMPKSVNNIKLLAKKIKDSKDVYVIGRGISYPTSLEAALKIKEISYIHAEGLAAGELKHGPLALIEKGTPCIAFLPNDETYGANLAGAMEMKARGGFVIGISFKRHEVFDFFIKVPDTKVATIIPNVIVSQLLAYYLTIEKGYDPDMPRNLAKSVTVK